MNVEIVHHNMPASNKRLYLDGVLDVIEKVSFVPSTTRRSGANLATGNVKIDDECLRTVPDILKLLILYRPPPYWQFGMLTFQGLHTTQFISTDHAFAFLDQLGRLPIQVIDIFNFLVELFVMNFRQPIAHQMGLKVALFLKASPRVEVRFRQLCLVS